MTSPPADSAQPEDPLLRAIGQLTPDARRSLQRALKRALGVRDAEPEVVAADLVNTDVELLDLGAGASDLGWHVARAARDAERAPLVRIDDGDGYALLVSPQHLWRLVDRVDEHEVAIGVLAIACARGLGESVQLERLLAGLDG